MKSKKRIDWTFFIMALILQYAICVFIILGYKEFSKYDPFIFWFMIGLFTTVTGFAIINWHDIFHAKKPKPKPLNSKATFIVDFSESILMITLEIINGNRKLALELAKGIPTFDIADAHRLITSIETLYNHQTKSK